ncbi:DUF6477 family protein [Celeribacter arenosi]|uniref:DNA polymerase III subunit delta n=1 Tax=Celeribacter arenosi TaxID=792649 RepID=A0ABP7KGU8_9RHOB
MTDIFALLAGLRRPRLLIRAARFGVNDYNRSRDLRRLTGSRAQLNPSTAVTTLIEEEARIDAVRRTGDASYNVTRHVELLIALMGEARLLTKIPQAA